MINDLIDAISLALSTEFPESDGYEVYDDNPSQGLVEPCFLITLVNPTNNQFKNNRYKRTHLFDIQYFPKKGRKEMHEVNDRLFLCLQRIKDLNNETYVGSNMNGEIRGGVLNFFVHYNFFVDVNEVAGDPMESIETNQTARS